MKKAFANWMKACRKYWTEDEAACDLGPKLALHVIAIPFSVTTLVMIARLSTFGSVLLTLMTASALAVVWFRYGGEEKED